jgi:two-component system, OmpR family, sensor histidine kinase BaeS
MMNYKSLPENLQKFLSTTSAKIAIGILFITIILLTYIGIFAISTAQNEFQTAAIRFIGEDQDLFFVRQIPLPDRFEPIRAQFNERLSKAILLAGVLGTIMAIVAGIIFSTAVTKPLRQIKKGISNLKTSNYKEKLDLTGEKEFDEVISEFNDFASELEYQETLRKDLISDVSHELKTPLTSLLGQVQGIKDKIFEFDEKRLDIIQNDVERLTHLVNMLQEYTRVRSRIMSVNKEEINLHNLIEDTKKTFEVRLQESEMIVANEVEENIKIMADNIMLRRILENLIENSIKYSKGKVITIKADSDSITVSDDGVGIPQEHLQKIFERFYRVEKSRNRTTGGLGLGLSLVKEMVEAHNWKISAENNLEKGVYFKINLLS